MISVKGNKRGEGLGENTPVVLDSKALSSKTGKSKGKNIKVPFGFSKSPKN